MKCTVGIIQINVTDLDEARRFYFDILGFNDTKQWNVSSVASLEAENAPQILLYPVSEMVPVDYPNQTGTTIVFYVDDLDRTIEEWRTRGVEFIPIAWSTDESGIGNSPFGRFIAFRDPFGNIHEILQPVEHEILVRDH